MADMAPFRAWKYDFSRIGPPSEVLAPPYDVISHGRARELAKASPHHVIHLILGKPAPGASFGSGDYQRAAETWDAWRRDGVLVRDEQPSLYVYDIEFSDLITDERTTRTGVIGALKLETFEAGVVLPHEEIFQGPLSDRINLMRAADAVFSPIFGLHEDPGGAATAALTAKADEAFIETADGDGCVHRVRRVTDAEAIEGFCAALAARTVIIADGHHRYTAALEHARAKGRLGGKADGSRTMFCLTPSDDPGLRAYGTHRLFRGLGGAPDLAPLADLARIQPLPDLDAAAAIQVVESAPAKLPTYVFATRGGLHRVSVEDPSRLERLLVGVHPALRADELTILHRAILTALGIGASGIDVAGGVGHTRDAAEALREVRQGEADLAVLVRSPGGAELAAVCAAGQRMPQKTTYFYPKLLSGCVFLDLSG
jgi:uncharacterized protein (DUF1015 family)